MSKQSILIIMPYMNCGGVESTLLSMLDVIDKRKYAITLLLLEKKGTFLTKIPKEVKVKEIDIPEKEKGVFFGKRLMMENLIKKGQWYRIPEFLLYNFKTYLSEDRARNASYFQKISAEIPSLKGKYDLAIDYFGYATFTTFYLAEKVNATVKISWLHSVLSRYNPQSFEQWYKKMHVIYACSKMVKKDFETIFPELNNVKLFYNIIHPEVIRKKAQEDGGFEDDFDGIRILTVGRVCHEKGIDIAIEAFKSLFQSGYKVRWYLIGGGSKEDYCRYDRMLNTNEERNNFCFLGVKENPYVYMKQCDIYVQPSRFEGYCTTTNEARIIGKPIIMTNVSGAEEQISNGVTGYIVDTSGKAIFEAIKKIIENQDIRKRFSDNLKGIRVDTTREIEKIYALLDRE